MNLFQQPCNAFMIKMFFDHERYTVVAHRLLLHLNLNLNGRRESVGRAPYVKSAQIRKEFSMSRHNISGAREPTFRAFDLDQTCAEVGSSQRLPKISYKCLVSWTKGLKRGDET